MSEDLFFAALEKTVEGARAQLFLDHALDGLRHISKCATGDIKPTLDDLKAGIQKLVEAAPDDENRLPLLKIAAQVGVIQFALSMIARIAEDTRAFSSQKPG